MRTSLILNDEVLVEAKKMAADRQCTLSTLVNDALRRMIQTKIDQPGQAFVLPTFRGEQTAATNSPTELVETDDSEELALYLR